MNEQGRITIPIKFRKALALEAQQPLVMQMQDGKLIIQDKAQLEREMIAFFNRQKEHLGSTDTQVVEELIRERRQAASQE